MHLHRHRMFASQRHDARLDYTGLPGEEEGARRVGGGGAKSEPPGSRTPAKAPEPGSSTFGHGARQQDQSGERNVQPIDLEPKWLRP